MFFQALTSIKDLFGPCNTPEFKRIKPADIAVPNLDLMKVMQTQNLSRMKKSYDEAQRQIQKASYDKLGQRPQRYYQAIMVDLLV